MSHHAPQSGAWPDPSFRSWQPILLSRLPKLVRRHGFVASMSGRGNCYDNAMVETVFKTIKSELIWRTSFDSRWQASNAIGRYIEGFYNPRRRHSSLGYTSPTVYEAAFSAGKMQERVALQ